jgi:DNA-binding transcriptional LysR family regulator
MQLRHLKTFAAVASTLNMTRAAQRVHLAQSSVTEQIQALEGDVGAALFDRSRRGLQLTEAGRTLLAYCEDLLALADEARAAVADAAGISGGRLTVGALETLCAHRLSPILAQFGQTHPAVALQLKVAGSGALRNAVRVGEMDVCFAFGQAARDDGLRTEEIAEEPLVIIAPRRRPGNVPGNIPGNIPGNATGLTTADLAGTAFLVTETGCVYRRMFEDAFPPDRPGRPRIAGEFNSVAALRSLVAAGAGCALVPRLVAEEAGDTVTCLPWTGSHATVPITMSWRARRVQPKVVGLFLDAARGHFRALRPADDRHPHATPSR